MLVCFVATQRLDSSMAGMLIQPRIAHLREKFNLNASYPLTFNHRLLNLTKGGQIHGDFDAGDN